jgi:glutathione synthase/RimK-type ligase-like ATP-grasp enzyme
MNSVKKKFGIIVLYSEAIVHSAGDKKYGEKTPFSIKGRRGEYNDCYRYFLLKCKKMGIEAALVSSVDIIGPGLFQSFWTYDRKWIRNDGQAYSRVIFDKFTPLSIDQKNKLKLLTSSKSVFVFNNKKIKDIFQNKLETYQYFEEYAIPTVEIIGASKPKIESAKRSLDKLSSKHKFNADFIHDYILKDNTGAGGFKIYKVDFDKYSFKEIKKQHKLDKRSNAGLSYVLQAFIDCNHGFVFGKYEGMIDLRVIILKGKIIQTYIRIAKKGNFKCNAHQGGNVVYMPIDKIPTDVLAMTKKIMQKLKDNLNIDHSLYALDFIRSNNGNLYFIEGNTNPGINWNYNNKIDVIKSKELIDYIIEELVLIIKEKG